MWLFKYTQGEKRLKLPFINIFSESSAAQSIDNTQKRFGGNERTRATVNRLYLVFVIFAVFAYQIFFEDVWFIIIIIKSSTFSGGNH